MSDNEIRAIIMQRAKERGVSNYRIALDTGILESSLSAYWNGKGLLAEKNLQKLFDYLELEVK